MLRKKKSILSSPLKPEYSKIVPNRNFTYILLHVSIVLGDTFHNRLLIKIGVIFNITSAYIIRIVNARVYLCKNML